MSNFFDVLDMKIVTGYGSETSSRMAMFAAFVGVVGCMMYAMVRFVVLQ